MLDKLDAALRFGQEALNLRAQRQEILAANIANADTGLSGAGYRFRQPIEQKCWNKGASTATACR